MPKLILRDVIAALAVALLPSASCHAGFIWGVNGHPLASYPGVSVEEQLDYVHDLGMTSYRFDVSGTDKLPDMLRLVREAKLRNITPLPVITPAFNYDKEPAETLRRQAYGLAFALVSSFKGEIPVWELGNELENYAIIKPCEKLDNGKQYNCAWGPAGGNSPLDYFGARWAKVSAVIDGLAEGTRAADPAVRRAVGTAGWGHIGAFERLKADGIEWDISVWHMYGEDPEWAFKKLREYGHPIWVTEVNHPLGSQKGEEQQAQGLVRWMARLTELRDSYGVEAAHVYELMDEPYWGKDFEASMGLVAMKKIGEGHWRAANRKAAFDAVKAQITGVSAQSRLAREIVVNRQCDMKPGTDAATADPRAVVAYVYCLVLGRAPDGAGLTSYASQITADLPVSQLVVGMLNSEEFTSQHGARALPTDEYVRTLYKVLLGAEPSETELKTAVAALESKVPREQLQHQLVSSDRFRLLHPTLFKTLAALHATAPVAEASAPLPAINRTCDVGILHKPLEFERGQVIYGYCLVLGRWPDGAGLAAWTSGRRTGVSLENFLSGLLQSNEFAAKFKTAALDDAGYVTLLDRLLLDREPKREELDHNVSQLGSGELTRVQLAAGILGSDEFRKRQEALFNARMPEKARAEAQQ